ncbi:MAG: hypothetical protein KatS3mg114_0498 [Planctomycetaceae bacterium]|nr:MAG: hypothetical protein KatS3mg114_0498 [Planctomycetaceae bacterium]
MELFADDTKLVRGLKAAETRLKAFGAGVQAIGTRLFGLGSAAVAPLLATTNVFASMGDQLAKMSLRTGISVESLSELGYAADQSGASIEMLEGGVRKMQKFLLDAAEGSTTAEQTLSRLGLSLSDLGSRSPEQQFELIADRLSQIQDPAIRAATAMEVFGKTGTSLLPLMQDGAKGIADLRQQARDLGLVISTEDAQAAEVFGDRLSDLWKVIKSGVFAIGAALAPLLQDLAIRATRIAKVTADWVRENKALIVTVFKIAAGVAAGGAALIVLGTLISGVGAAFGVAASVITGVGTVLGVIGTVIGALLSPIGLVTAAVVGLGAYLLYVSGTGSQALEWLADTFQSLKQDALAAWQGIGDALAAGDLALAAKILWLTLKMEWQKGIAFLQQHWIAFKEFFLSLASDAFYGAVSFLIDAWAGLQVAWVETTTFLADAWTVFTSSLTKGWNTAQNFISKGVLRLMKLFDSELDVEAASRILDEDFQRQNTETDRRAQRLIGDRDRQRQAQRTQIETERQGAQGEISRQAEAERLTRQQQNAAELEATGDALAKAREEWEAALAEAAQKRSEVEANAPERTRRAQDELAGMDDLLSQVAEERVSTKGTFNAAAVRGFGGGSVADRTAKATEETAKNTKRLLEQSQHGKLVFT